MYAEYWNPMKFRKTIPSMNGNTVREKTSLRKLSVVPGRYPPLAAAWAIWRPFTPPVYCGRLCWKSLPLVARRPNTNMSTNPATPIAARAVTNRWKDRVGRSTTPAISASTTSDAMKPGVPVIAPLESVNQVFASLKKLPPAPMPMMRAVIWRFRRTSGISNAMIATEARTSVQPSIQPRNGWTMRLVKT